MSKVFSLETLDSLISFNREFAQEHFKKYGELHPMIVGYSRDNQKRYIIYGLFSSPKEKSKWLMFATLLFSIYDVDKYVVMSESWAVKDENAYEKHSSLETHPNRISVLTVVAVNKHGSKIVVDEILDTKTLKTMSEQGDVTGAFCDLLPKKLLTKDEKELTANLLSVILGTEKWLTLKED